MRRLWLLPLVPVYGAVLWLKRWLVEERAEYSRRLAWPVVSVGSLSAGGAGKTPVVAALAALLGRAGYGVDVLSRGYGRGAAAAVERVDASGSAERFGDEPMLLARLTGVPVYVGADRYRAGLLAERDLRVSEQPMSRKRDMGHPDPYRTSGLESVGSAGADANPGRRVHLLDDGFQHRRLGRVLDVVLLTGRDVADWLLPAGDLREPLWRLRRAGVVVVREEEAEALRPVVRRLASAAMPLWVIRRELELPGGSGGKMLAFCGVARPEGFFAMLRAGGVIVAGTVVFRDHHRYGERDLMRLAEAAQRCAAEGFVTTEKDAVKLSAAMRGRLERVGPVVVAGLSVRFLDEATVLAGVAAAIEAG